MCGTHLSRRVSGRVWLSTLECGDRILIVGGLTALHYPTTFSISDVRPVDFKRCHHTAFLVDLVLCLLRCDTTDVFAINWNSAGRALALHARSRFETLHQLGVHSALNRY